MPVQKKSGNLLNAPHNIASNSNDTSVSNDTLISNSTIIT